MAKLSHLNNEGKVNMVDVEPKAETRRVAKARAVIRAGKEVIDLIKKGQVAKGNIEATVKLAGIMAAKKTSELIPLCHPLNIEKISLNLELKEDLAMIESTVVCSGKTGVEMEALTAVSVAALTFYDMCKAVNKGICIENIELLHKSGGKSGDYSKD